MGRGSLGRTVPADLRGGNRLQDRPIGDLHALASYSATWRRSIPIQVAVRVSVDTDGMTARVEELLDRHLARPDSHTVNPDGPKFACQWGLCKTLQPYGLPIARPGCHQADKSDISTISPILAM
jgi:hypothetical protein